MKLKAMYNKMEKIKVAIINNMIIKVNQTTKIIKSKKTEKSQ